MAFNTQTAVKCIIIWCKNCILSVRPVYFHLSCSLVHIKGAQHHSLQTSRHRGSVPLMKIQREWGMLHLVSYVKKREEAWAAHGVAQWFNTTRRFCFELGCIKGVWYHIPKWHLLIPMKAVQQVSLQKWLLYFTNSLYLECFWINIMLHPNSVYYQQSAWKQAQSLFYIKH